MESRNVFLADAAATQALGRELAEQWLTAAAAAQGTGATPAILLLEGDLGAGKTCLVQGIAEGLGIPEAITSPTFALAHHYGETWGRRSGHALVHLDLYRLELPAAADELFAQEEEEALALGALLAVEWPCRLSFRPERAWRIKLSLAWSGDPASGRLALVDQPGLP
ncbi:tRNA (adenosine(37)-N6)-threonylcarbamoyltransferase complex ATPase subunit type 1 TsaE [Vulcanococcus limneticus]|uniref:tRNA (adenosine(37)-N6)-threonylcarbamoyltransferase complex ATPase subunit type 1 TsaE n=1 Tax=Vulcanococcus limneticus TaxID=2170428 RepID=UPI00398BFF6B